MAFGDIVGHQRAIAVLRNALRSDSVAHAYLFAGLEGIGKRRVALEFAKALNCESGVTATPCGRCSACVEICPETSLFYSKDFELVSERPEDLVMVLRPPTNRPEKDAPRIRTYEVRR